jgi:hypothetical protein
MKNHTPIRTAMTKDTAQPERMACAYFAGGDKIYGKRVPEMVRKAAIRPPDKAILLGISYRFWFRLAFERESPVA